MTVLGLIVFGSLPLQERYVDLNGNHVWLIVASRSLAACHVVRRRIAPCTHARRPLQITLPGCPPSSAGAASTACARASQLVYPHKEGLWPTPLAEIAAHPR